MSKTVGNTVGVSFSDDSQWLKLEEDTGSGSPNNRVGLIEMKTLGKKPFRKMLPEPTWLTKGFTDYLDPCAIFDGWMYAKTRSSFVKINLRSHEKIQIVSPYNFLPENGKDKVFIANKELVVIYWVNDANLIRTYSLTDGSYTDIEVPILG